MAQNTLKIAGVAGSALLLAGGAGALALTTQAPEAQAAPVQQAAVQQAGAETPKPAAVVGTFAYTQTEVTPTPQVAARMGEAARYLCGSSLDASPSGVAAAEWELAVTGDVEQELVAPLGQLAEEGAYHAVMGCSCAGNEADGLASVNAEVEGITIAYLLEASGASLDANTIVFVSEDGYEVALPLSYVAQRASMIVYALNGEELSGSVGGTNQLWLGSTSARYFARNVVEVRVETRDAAEVPPVPGTAEADDAYANVPNIAVVFGGEA